MGQKCPFAPRGQTCPEPVVLRALSLSKDSDLPMVDGSLTHRESRRLACCLREPTLSSGFGRKTEFGDQREEFTRAVAGRTYTLNGILHMWDFC